MWKRRSSKYKTFMSFVYIILTSLDLLYLSFLLPITCFSRIAQLEMVRSASHLLQRRISEQRLPMSLRRSLHDVTRRENSPLGRTSAALVDSVREIGSALGGGVKPVRRLSVPKSISIRDRLLLLDLPDGDADDSREASEEKSR